MFRSRSKNDLDRLRSNVSSSNAAEVESAKDQQSKMDRSRSTNDLHTMIKFPSSGNPKGLASSGNLKGFGSSGNLKGFASSGNLKRFPSSGNLKRFPSSGNLKRFPSSGNLKASADQLSGMSRSRSKNDLYKMLDSDPWQANDSAKSYHDAIRDVIQSNPSAAVAKYDFKALCGARTHYPLFMAVTLGTSSEALMLLCDACPEALKDVDDIGDCVLHYACRYTRGENATEVVQLLLERREDMIRAKNMEGQTPLHYACRYGQMSVVSLLVDRYGAAVGGRDTWGRTPLYMAYLACRNGEASSTDAVRYIAEKYPKALDQWHSEETVQVAAAGCRKSNPELGALLSTLHTLHCRVRTDEELCKMLRASHGMKWKTRAAPILDSRPTIASELDLEVKVMPMFLHKIGRECRQRTMFDVVKTMSHKF